MLHTTYVNFYIILLLIIILFILIYIYYVSGGKISGVRYLQSFLLFLCLFATYLLRVSISVAIVAMTPDKNSTDYLTEKHYHIPVSKITSFLSYYKYNWWSYKCLLNVPLQGSYLCVHFSYIFKNYTQYVQQSSTFYLDSWLIPIMLLNLPSMVLSNMYNLHIQ